MRIELALKHRDRALTALRDLFSSAEIFGLSSATMEERRHEALSAFCAKCPYWVRSYLDGAWQQMIHDAYSRKLVYGGFYAGKFCSTHRNRPDYYETQDIEPRDFADHGNVYDRGHYWARSVDAGTPKPFFKS